MVVVYFAAMAYFIFKLVRMYDTGDMDKVTEYLPARKALTVFAVITILLLIITIAVACVCANNFNKGLKPHISKRKVPDANEPKYYQQTEMPAYGGGGASGDLGADIHKILRLVKDKSFDPVIVFSFSRRQGGTRAMWL